jgi:SAM-dependent methyltransferase
MEGPVHGARAQRQGLVDRHFEVAAGYWKAIYEEPTVYGAIYQERRSTALSWIDELALPGGTTVLEIGCGAGLTSVALAERGFEVTATDNVEAMVGLTNQLARDRMVSERLRTAMVDVHNLPFEDCSFSGVLALGVLPWLHSPEQAVAEMARVLRPGGFMLVNVDNVFRLHYWLDPHLNPAVAPVRDLLRRWLRRTGTRAGSIEPTLVHLDRPRRLDLALSCAGLTKARGATIGFGPFSFWGRRILTEHEGKRLHRKLQGLADRRVPLLRSMGAQYVVLGFKADET